MLAINTYLSPIWLIYGTVLLNKNNMKPKNNSSARIAMKDISEYLHNQDIKIVDENQDVWIVTPSRMQNKETRKLNSKLGLHKINKFWIRVSRNK